jgi:uncharacterized MAPEG superfamily protein
MPDVALLSIPAYWATAFGAHMYALRMVLTSPNPKAYNNVNARQNDASIERALGPEKYRRYQRAKSAQANAHESLPLFIAAVLVSKYAGVSADTFAMGSLALRLLYMVLYVNTTDPKKSNIRTVVWFVLSMWSLVQIVRCALVAT